MSTVPIVKKETATEDILKLLAEQVKKQKIGQIDTKSLIHLFRPLAELLSINDTLSADANSKELAEIIGLSESLTSSMVNRFELEAVDNSHANETAVKIGIWELVS